MQKIFKTACKYAVMFVILSCITALFTYAATLPTEDNDIVRVGLFYDNTGTTDVTLSSDGGFFITIPNIDADIYSETDTITISVSGSMLKITNSNGTDLAFSSSGEYVSVNKVNSDSFIYHNSKPYRGDFYFYFNAYGLITSVNVLEIDEYLMGVLPSEIYPSWHIEALKTSAIVSRTFALDRTFSSPHSASGFDICSNTHCQMYNGASKEDVRTNDAIVQTEGTVVVYNGSLATTPYHSSSGGYTESAASAWGGSPESYPYLTHVFNPFEDYESVPNGSWRRIVPVDELIDYVPSYYRAKLTGQIKSIDCQRNEAGFVDYMTVTDTNGFTLTITTSQNVRSFFGSLVKSANFGIVRTFMPTFKTTVGMFVLTAHGEASLTGINGYSYASASGTYKTPGFTEVYLIDGKGYGHGVGLSAYGNMFMANNGFTHDEILSTYFPGTELINYIYTEEKMQEDTFSQEQAEIQEVLQEETIIQ